MNQENPCPQIDETPDAPWHDLRWVSETIKMVDLGYRRSCAKRGIVITNQFRQDAIAAIKAAKLARDMGKEEG